jgi:hypothetical protein
MIIAEFERMMSDLEREIHVEDDRTGTRDPDDFAYPTSAKPRSSAARTCRLIGLAQTIFVVTGGKPTDSYKFAIVTA